MKKQQGLSQFFKKVPGKETSLKTQQVKNDSTSAIQNSINPAAYLRHSSA
jgi:hypothetical protein